ncbi:MAG: M12 family metallo-peptidase, partial [Planctomycetota bacterium]
LLLCSGAGKGERQSRAVLASSERGYLMQTIRSQWIWVALIFVSGGANGAGSGVTLGPQSIDVRTPDFVLIVDAAGGHAFSEASKVDRNFASESQEHEGSCVVMRETPVLRDTTTIPMLNAEPCDLFGGLVRIELSVDVDSALYTALGADIDPVVLFVEDLISQVDEVYRRDFGAVVKLRTLVVRTSAIHDPYQEGDSLSIITALRDLWNTQLTEQRGDMVHLLSGRDFEGTLMGRSYLDGACGGNRYSISSILASGGTLLQTQLVAHELGHSLGAEHCNHPSSNNYSETCNIMCTSIGGCSGPGLPSFGPGSTTMLSTAIAESTNCECLDRLMVCTADLNADRYADGADVLIMLDAAESENTLIADRNGLDGIDIFDVLHFGHEIAVCE